MKKTIFSILTLFPAIGFSQYGLMTPPSAVIEQKQETKQTNENLDSIFIEGKYVGLIDSVSSKTDTYSTGSGKDTTGKTYPQTYADSVKTRIQNGTKNLTNNGIRDQFAIMRNIKADNITLRITAYYIIAQKIQFFSIYFPCVKVFSIKSSHHCHNFTVIKKFSLKYS